MRKLDCLVVAASNEAFAAERYRQQQVRPLDQRRCAAREQIAEHPPVCDGAAVFERANHAIERVRIAIWSDAGVEARRAPQTGAAHGCRMVSEQTLGAPPTAAIIHRQIRLAAHT